MNESQIEVSRYMISFVKNSNIVLHVANGISTFLNLFVIIALISFKLNNRIRKYLKFIFFVRFCMNFCSSIGVQESGIFTDESEIYNSLYTHVLRIYFLKCFNEIFSSCLGFTELIMTIEKRYAFRNHKNRLTKCKLRYILGFMITLSSLIMLPEFFTRKISFISPGVYKRSINLFEKSLFYDIYINILSLFVLIVVTFHIFNTIFLIIEYKKFLKNKNNMKSQSNQSKDSLTKFILIQSFLNYTYCILYIASTSKIRYDNISEIQYDPLTIVLRYSLHLYGPINNSLCSLLIFRLDKQLNRLTKRFLRIR